MMRKSFWQMHAKMANLFTDHAFPVYTLSQAHRSCSLWALTEHKFSVAVATPWEPGGLSEDSCVGPILDKSNCKNGTVQSHGPSYHENMQIAGVLTSCRLAEGLNEASSCPPCEGQWRIPLAQLDLRQCRSKGMRQPKKAKTFSAANMGAAI